VTNKEILRLKLVRRSRVEELAEMLEQQERKLRELEAKLQSEKQEKANLMSDFQHLLDLFNAKSNQHFRLTTDQAVVCG
jgi:hypothetical protein